MTYVHRFSSHPELEFEALEPHFMRAYIAHVRQYEPTVPEDVAAHVVDEYVAMRNGADAATGFGFTTARTLLAILRLSQALARLHQRHEASRDDTPTLTLTLTPTPTPAPHQVSRGTYGIATGAAATASKSGRRAYRVSVRVRVRVRV